MNLLPEFDSFREGYARGLHQAVYARLAADLDTPVSLYLKLSKAEPDSFLLESVTGGEIRGRYSVIGLRPDMTWECRGRESASRTFEDDGGARLQKDAQDPIRSLRSLLEWSRIELPEGLPPMSAGLFGYLGYDMVRLVERLPDVNPDPIGLPDAMMMRPSLVVSIDGVKNEVTLVSPAWVLPGRSAEDAYRRSSEHIEAAIRAIDGPIPPFRGECRNGEAAAGEPVSNISRDEYLRVVETAKDYIRAGDIFQVVPSQRWAMDFRMPPFALYRALRRTNPSPYMFYFNFGGFQVCGASPETLVKLRDGIVTIRPIAGTRRRGTTPAEDKALEREMLGDPKEMAEHLMLLDLGRNDVGRVACIGTVKPTESFNVERYSHVMHIVSNVTGEIAEGEDALSALLAGLPAGTVSGAPKVRAMEIIDELEPEKRGVYAGGVGYFSCAGDMDLCIALRTAVLKDGTLYVQAGGGVVHDSDPETEYQETVNKADALTQAARDAADFVELRNTESQAS